MRQLSLFLAAVGIVLLAFSSAVPEAHASSRDPAAFVIVAQPSPVRPGEIVHITVTARIDPGWHLYGLTPTPPPGPEQTSIQIAGNGLSQVGSVSEDVPIQKLDPNFGKTVGYHENAAVFDVSARVDPKARVSPIDASIDITYQTCNAQICLPPRTKTLETLIVVAAGPVRTQYSQVVLARHVATKPASSSLPLFLLAALGAGLLALVTPCVFPLIPITLTSFVKQADGHRRKLVQLSIGYAAGIVALYVAVGALVSILLGAGGADRLAANPWVNLFAFTVFVVFALSFFETIKLQLPGNLGGLQAAARKQSAWLSLSMLGIVFVLASFTCTAPFIGTLLVAAAGGERFRPLLGMLTFAIAFVSPFLIFACFPQWINRIPKGGIWLARVKATFGFIELAAALKFLSNADLIWRWKILTQPVLLAAWAMLLLAASFYLIGLLKFGVAAEEEHSRVSPVRAGFAALFALAALYCFWGLSGRPMNAYLTAFLPPEGYGFSDAVAATPAGLPWQSDYAQAAAEARSERKPLLIDFTGYTCTNCRLNEKSVFPDPGIQSQLANFVRVQLYTDGGADANKNQNLEVSKFSDVALPLYGVVDAATGKPVDKTAGVQSVSGFSAFLKRNASVTASVAPTAAEWSAFSPSSVGTATVEGRPVVIDFTANWCTNCKAIERTVFPDPRVASLLPKFNSYRCDMTNYYTPANALLQKKYGVLALPTIIFLDARGKEAPGTRVTGLVSAREFASRMQRATVL